MENNEELLNNDELSAGLPEEELSQDEVYEVEETEVEGEEIETELEEENAETVADNTDYSEEVLYEVILQNEVLYDIESTLSEQKQTIWEKPIEEYTVTEGLLLIIMFIVLAYFVFDIIGGILCLK